MTAKNSKSTSKTRKPLSDYISLRKDCRACGGPLETILNLGTQEIISLGDKEKRSAPLELTKCQSCSLVQLRHTVDREYLFRSYYYRSGATQTMKDHLKGVVEDVMKRVELKPKDLVIDVGSNDETLLGFYPKGVYRLGFEPSVQTRSDLGHDLYIHGGFFGLEGFPDRYRGLLAKVITAIAMFYDLDDPNAFLQDVKKVLAPDGLFCLQVNYLPDTLRNNAVGDICHEHLCYYRLNVLGRLLEKNGLHAFDVSFNEINGGSMRLFIHHCEQAGNTDLGDSPDKVEPFLKKTYAEAHLCLDTLSPYQAFADRISTIARKTREYVETLRKLGKTVSVIGASTRGATFIQYADLNRYGILIDCVERDASKVGKRYLGLKIISEDEDRATPSDWYLLAMPWLEKEVRERMPWVKRLILPLPEPRIVVDGRTSPL